MELYLELMKRCLIDYIYADVQEKPNIDPLPFEIGKRLEGRDWPAYAHSMIGMKRLNNLQFCVEDVLRRGVPGDLIETGVWRGGAVIFMRAILKAYGVTDRVVWAADSFAGLPLPDAERFPVDAGDRHHEFQELIVPLERVKENFRRYDLLDEQVCFLPGWFKETLPTAPIRQLAVIRLDGDMYGSTWEALENLYPKLSVGGYCIIDDYALAGCRQAVDDFRSRFQIAEEMKEIDWTGRYWQKTEKELL
ncbi:MAG TPA: TylF/MycF family methyltransferase [Blastocatellia bacterium]|nr:TylF/MycF family methyltransferase [Blastocatellia bacterium]